MITVTALERGIRLFTSWRNVYFIGLWRRFYWSGPLLLFTLCYYPFCLTALLEFTSSDGESRYEAFSLACAQVLIVAAVVWLIASICLAVPQNKN